MNIVQSVQSVFKKYAVFKGRASRSEFWWWILASTIIELILRAISPALYGLWGLATLIPALAVAVLRMHDSDHNGWWIICPIVNLVFSLFPSTPGPNRYGAPNGGPAAVVDETQLSGGAGACAACGKMRLPGQNFCQGCGAKFE